MNYCMGPTSPVWRWILDISGFQDLLAVELQVNKLIRQRIYVHSCAEIYAAKTSMIQYRHYSGVGHSLSPSLFFQWGSRKGLGCISTRQLKRGLYLNRPTETDTRFRICTYNYGFLQTT